MNVPPLAILQARMGSTRLPGKVLFKIGPETMVERIHRIACEAFGREHVVVSIPAIDENGQLHCELQRIGAEIALWSGDENDVLGRFSATANSRRWRQESVIVRVTCDDPFKTVDALRRVANGERLPVELGGEAFTLAMLDNAVKRAYRGEGYPWWRGGRLLQDEWREHITYILFPNDAPPAPSDDVWTVDTLEDYERAVERYEREKPGLDAAARFDAWCERVRADPLSVLRAIQAPA